MKLSKIIYVNKWVGWLESLGNDDFQSTLFIVEKKLTISNINIFQIYSKDLTAAIYLFKVRKENTQRMNHICSKLTIKYQNNVNDIVLVSLLQSWNMFHSLFVCSVKIKNKEN